MMSNNYNIKQEPNEGGTYDSSKSIDVKKTFGPNISQGDKNNDSLPRMKLAGAAKRRLKKLIAKGMPRDDALKIVRGLHRLPLPTDVAPQGNAQSIELNTQCNEVSQTNTILPSTIPRTPESTLLLEEEKTTAVASEGDNCLTPTPIDIIRVGIRDMHTILDTNQLKMLAEFILSRIDAMPVGSRGPQFLGCVHRPGWLLFNCVNEHTSAWLEQVITEHKPWENSNLVFMRENEFPMPHVGIAWFPGRHWDKETIEHRISVQNRSFSQSGAWGVLRILPKEGGQTVAFTLDDDSLTVLEKQDSLLFFDMGFVDVKVMRDTSPFSGSTNDWIEQDHSRNHPAGTSQEVTFPGGLSANFSSSEQLRSTRDRDRSPWGREDRRTIECESELLRDHTAGSSQEASFRREFSAYSSCGEQTHTVIESANEERDSRSWEREGRRTTEQDYAGDHTAGTSQEGFSEEFSNHPDFGEQTHTYMRSAMEERDRSSWERESRRTIESERYSTSSGHGSRQTAFPRERDEYRRGEGSYHHISKEPRDTSPLRGGSRRGGELYHRTSRESMREPRDTTLPRGGDERSSGSFHRNPRELKRRRSPHERESMPRTSRGRDRSQQFRKY